MWCKLKYKLLLLRVKLHHKFHRKIPYLCKPQYHHRERSNIYLECPVCLRRNICFLPGRYHPIDSKWLFKKDIEDINE